MSQLNPWLAGNGPRGSDYDDRFERLAASGHDVHGEANLVAAFAPRSVLDAGCGTGRVGIELAARGIHCTGVDLDPSMLHSARAKAPHIEWIESDLATVDVGRTFDAVVAAGNVMIFLAPGTLSAVLVNLAAHLNPSGVLIAGFSLGRAVSIDDYDELAQSAGLRLVARYATWDQRPFADGDYAVSVHERVHN